MKCGYIGRREYRNLEKRIARIEKEMQLRLYVLEIILEFCRSVANKEKMSLLSYQQLNSPSADCCEKVRMLLQKIRKFR